MKNYFIILIVLITTFTKAQIVNIPDANFKNALVNTLCVDTNGDGIFDDDADINNDGEIQVSEAEAVINLWVYNNNIVSMEGIQSFSNLEYLHCMSNQISFLDVTQNLNLTILKCHDNQLSNLDVTQNVNLETLAIGSNNLTEIDVSQNENLKGLSCPNNMLSNLDFTQNTNLTVIFCQSNQLASLDLSQNPNLVTFVGYNNLLSELDVSQNTNLITLWVSDNQLISLTISQNSIIEQIFCSNNQLTNLEVSQCQNLKSINFDNNQIINSDLSQNPNLEEVLAFENQLTSLNINNGNNINLTRMISYNNPNLECIQVDDEIYSNNQVCSFPLGGWCKDDTAQYSEECILGIESNLSPTFTIYPNPIQNTISISTTGQIETVKIYSLQGQLLKESTNTTLDVSSLSSGVYFIQVLIEGKIITKKIVKL